ncbi:MAG: S8 family serine peptidase [Planctomycetaceae bacterium]
MAKRAARGPVDRNADAGDSGRSGSSTQFDSGETTGRMIVTFRDGSLEGLRRGAAKLQDVAGISRFSSMSDSGDSSGVSELDLSSAMVMDHLGIAVVNGDPDQCEAMLSAATDDDGMVMEREYVNFALADLLDGDLLESPGEGRGMSRATVLLPPHLEYLRGYHEAVKHVYESMRNNIQIPGTGGTQSLTPTAAFADTASVTWGLQATGVLGTSLTGRGINVAILDTGLDTSHPDFRNRRIMTQSFVPGETAMDVHGHGTHCTGTACGPLRPSEGPRYGIAHEASIFHGKVLSNSGSGGDGEILAGINWAVQNRCQVISMSLGRSVRPGEAPMTAYEMAGQRALNLGSLIVAAAGNSSSRPGVINPVGSPANAASIVAVAAVDQSLQIARFSDGGINSNGGEVNIAAPGVAIRSSLPLPRRYAAWSGTSMATPHVAGIAALIAQQSSAFRGVALYRELRRRVQQLSLPARDVGNGLVRAI